MSAVEFFDTNVLIYSFDTFDPRKQGIAQGLVMRSLDGGIVTLTQVLAEFASALLHKMSRPSCHPVLRTILDSLSLDSDIAPDADMVRRAVEANSRYGLHFYDCHHCGCGTSWLRTDLV